MYRAPIEAILAAMRHAAGRQGLDEELARAVLEEAGRFAAEEIVPLAAVGDRQGAQFSEGVVTMPAGWTGLYRQWREGGWNGLSAQEDFGGQGLSVLLGTAVMEMWNSGAIAFALIPTLTAGAVEAIAAHASDKLKALHLQKLVSGEWTGTMNLTEPQAGSDVGALTTRAARAQDGTYRLFGQKIYITFGEHDMAENIVHLVLARLEGAPAGSRGISLFLVPKFLPDTEGNPGVRNDVVCGGIEGKLGIHASPTCTMLYGTGVGEVGGAGAVGWLVGEENRGLNAMFTMMNSARLAVGVQGVGVAEAATQKALAFAAERRQGRTATSEGSAPIIRHPDVQRTLLLMKALTGAARAICFACAHAIDRSREGGEEAGFWKARADLLTPVAKAFATDVGVEVANLGIGVHGGMGFVEETGAARLLRDARITPIYEGTNGIQAIDLVVRKLPLQEGRAVAGLLDEIGEIAERTRGANRPATGRAGEALEAALAGCREATAFVREAAAAGRQDTALFVATPYLRLLGLTLGGALLCGQALEADGEEGAALARFFAEACLPETGGLARQVLDGGGAAAAAATVLLPA